MKKLVMGVGVVLAVLLGACSTGLAPNSQVARQYVVKLADAEGSGSGVVIAPGVVLTAQHVAEHPGLMVDGHGVGGVVLASGKETVDLAVMHLPVACPCVRLADSDPQMDELVYVVGFPWGIANVVTVGRAQGVVEHIIVPGMFGVPMDLGRRLVLTAPVSPGNSGGAVFVFRNGEFQLVGILVEAAGSVSLAVPLSDIKAILSSNFPQ